MIEREKSHFRFFYFFTALLFLNTMFFFLSHQRIAIPCNIVSLLVSLLFSFFPIYILPAIPFGDILSFWTFIRVRRAGCHFSPPRGNVVPPLPLCLREGWLLHFLEGGEESVCLFHESACPKVSKLTTYIKTSLHIYMIPKGFGKVKGSNKWSQNFLQHTKEKFIKDWCMRKYFQRSVGERKW